MSGETVAVGAWEEDSNATGINGNQNNNSAGESGAAYVFTRSVPQVPPRFLIPTRDPGGVIHLPVEVTSGQTYTLQFSDDLNHWSDVTTERATSDRIEFFDASSNPSRMRLYRVREN